jgi:hypothetical protein
LELYLPEILDCIARGRVDFISAEPGKVVAGRLKKSNKLWWWSIFITGINNYITQRFLFDSGQDNSKEEIKAFDDTTEELIAADLFHLPFPTVWIEDYFSHNPNGLRYCYFCSELDGKIIAWSVTYWPADCESAKAFPIPASANRLSVLGVLEWDTKPSGFGFRYYVPDDASEVDPSGTVYKRISAATLMLEKFVATLAASNTVREPGETKRRSARPGRDPMSRREKDFKTVIYGYTHVSPPADDTVPAGEGGHRLRKRHFVRGYTWGRNTRPKEQQRWIAPFWRGRGEVVAQRAFYEVRSQSASSC